MKCRICNQKVKFIFSAKILSKYNIKYYKCDECGFIQTEKPFWLAESYTLPINRTDTGLVGRNIYLAKKVSVILFYLFDGDKKYLDYAGGYGLFTRLMRDIGFDFYWHDLYSSNLLASGFEYNEKMDIEAVTIFETFEHFSEPIKEIEKIKQISSNIIFSTELLPKSIPNPNEWWYYGFEHGQHISFYSLKTLNYIASKLELNFISNGKIHMFTDKNINSKLYKTLLSTANIGLFKIIKSKMHSKTMKDMYMIRETLGY